MRCYYYGFSLLPPVLMSSSSSSLTRLERRAAFSLAIIYAVRMLGLFMVLPVLALYVDHYPDATPLLIGLTLGIYGLTQALLQIPFGLLSDRWGRKPLIVVGLVLFALGSVVAALADSMLGLIVGRALQGAGAISAAVLALVADLSREEQRSKLMAILGVSIGFSFSLSLLLGPLFNQWLGLQGIFWLSAVLAAVAMAILLLLVPTPARARRHRDVLPVAAQLTRVVQDPELLRLNMGIFVLHLVLAACFVVLPLQLLDAGLAGAHHWQVYLPALLLGVCGTVPAIIYAERRRQHKRIFLLAISSLIIALVNFPWAMVSIAGALFTLAGFFCAFNILEANLPSMISRIAPADHKGSALGVYTTAQFLGPFLGGLLGGWVFDTWGADAVFLAAAGLCCLWLVLAFGMRPLPKLKSLLMAVGAHDVASARGLAEELQRVAGVAEAVVVADEGTAYLKIDPERLDRQALASLAR